MIRILDADIDHNFYIDKNGRTHSTSIHIPILENNTNNKLVNFLIGRVILI